MTTTPIFGLRHQANEDIQPTSEELAAFLASPKEERGSAKHEDDLTLYCADLTVIDEFEAKTQNGVGEYHLEERRFLGALSHVRFFNHTVKCIVEEYKYLYEKIRVLDFKKPRDFVRAVQEEIDSLDSTRKADQPKITRLQTKLDKRNEDIEALEKTRHDLTLELKNIALYVHDNLMRIKKLCELSITTINSLAADHDIEQEAIADLKKEFKDELRDRLQQGPVSRESAEQSKEDFLLHAKDLSEFARQDRQALTRIYEQVRGHVEKYAAELDALIRQVDAKKGIRFEEERDALGKINRCLISLISDYQFGGEKTEEIAHKDEHERLVALKRHDMLRRVFDLLQGKPHGSH
jgi:chromosome segregation ATPase